MDEKRRTDIMCCLCLITALMAFGMSLAFCYELWDDVRAIAGDVEQIEGGMTEIAEKVMEQEQEEDYSMAEIIPAPELESIGVFTLTAYCPCVKCCGEWGKNRPEDENGNPIVYGSAGIELQEGVSVAVDPSVIPYGSEIVIDGHTYTAHDCGGAIKNNRIDIYFADHDRALAFAVRSEEVFILA